MDLLILTSAKDRSAAAITSASDITALVGPDDFPQLVLNTTEPVTLKFLTGASAYETWTADPTYAFTVHLGLLTATGLDAYATATIGTVISNGKSGNLDLTGAALSNAMRLILDECRPGAAVILTLQVSVTAPAGTTRTYAQLPVRVNGYV